MPKHAAQILVLVKFWQITTNTASNVSGVLPLGTWQKQPTKFYTKANGQWHAQKLGHSAGVASAKAWYIVSLGHPQRALLELADTSARIYDRQSKQNGGVLTNQPAMY